MAVNHNLKKSREAAARREALIEYARVHGGPVAKILEETGTKQGTYNVWRYKHPEFGPRFDEARRALRQAGKVYDGTFVSFRLSYLGMDTTWFQQRIIEAIEAARPGEVVLILIPPEHGKTTLLEDWCTFKLVNDRAFRITVCSETVDHGKKIIARVRDRFEADGPCPALVRDFGPLAPQGGRSDQTWGATYFDIAGKKASDERDYSMSCVGLTGRVQGTRCNLMLMDDLQDLKSIDQTDKYFNIVKQSFLSRPSMFGRTVIIGTRVDEYDVYRRLKDAQIPNKVIEIPAYKVSESVPWPALQKPPQQDDEATWAPEGVKFLWPHKYDQIEEGGGYFPGLHRFRYAALRWRVGEQTWWRIYMQRPEQASSRTFDEETTKCMHDEQRSVIGDPRPVGRKDLPDLERDRPVPVIITVDPAIGSGTGVLSVAAYPKRMEVLSANLQYGLTKYSQIIELIEDACARWSTETSVVTTVVIEDKAFQKGLLEDDSMLALQQRYGFRIVPNTTGREKSDPDIGVPALPMAMVRQEITIPWADEPSQAAMWHLLDQLHQWRPGVNGVKLPQDLVMCLHFAYRKWRSVRETPAQAGQDLDAWRSKGSPLRNLPRRRSRHGTYRHRTRGGIR
jgi:hypothetical protein